MGPSAVRSHLVAQSIKFTPRTYSTRKQYIFMVHPNCSSVACAPGTSLDRAHVVPDTLPPSGSIVRVADPDPAPAHATP